MSERAFIDSSVLIKAAAGSSGGGLAVVEVLESESRTFVYSELVRLETLPKAQWAGRKLEVSFYEAFFSVAERTTAPIDSLLPLAFEIMRDDGIGPMDALHVAAALRADCSEFITLEKKTTRGSLHRTKRIKVRGL